MKTTTKWLIGIAVVWGTLTVIARARRPGVETMGFVWRPDGGVNVVDDAKAMHFAADIGKQHGGTVVIEKIDGNGGLDNWLVSTAAGLQQPYGYGYGVQRTPVDSIVFVYRLFRAAIQGAATTGLTPGEAKSLIIAMRIEAIKRLPAELIKDLPELDLQEALP